MMGRRIAVVGTLLVALLGAPRPSEAGLLDIIWEMSGPQMLGFAYGCLYSLNNFKSEQCRLGKVPTFLYLKKQADTDKPKNPFLGFSAGIYGSTGLNSSTQQYRWFELGMLELTTGLSFKSYETGGPNNDDVRVYHGFGVAYERFFGRGIEGFNNGAIDGFNKWAITVTPVDVTLNRVAFGIRMRLYPEGFSDDEFKKGLPPPDSRPFEATVSFTFSYIIRK
jgi:hypothetical protein